MFFKLYTLLTKKDQRLGYFLVLMMLIGASLEAIGIGLLVPILSAINNEDTFSRFLEPLTYFVVDQSSPEFIMLLFILLTVFFLCKNIFLAIMYWFQYKYIYRARANLSIKIFSWYLHENIFFHKSRNSSKLLNNLINDTNIFSSHGVLPILIIFTESFVLMAVTFLLLFLHPAVMTILLVFIGSVLFFFSYISKSSLKSWGEKRTESEAMRVKSIHQGLGSIKEILLRGSQNFFLNEYQIHNNSVASVLSKQATIQSLPRLIFETSAILFFCIFIFISAKKNIPLSDIISTITIFAFASVRLLPSISRLNGAIQNFRFAHPVIENFYDDKNFINTEFVKINVIKNKKVFKNKITLSNLSFRYPETDKFIIDNFNDSILYGECIGIVGKSGSGKSTLADIMLGLIEPTDGQILIDDIPIDLCKRDWQNNIGYVPQDVYLLDDTLEANIAFGIEKNKINKSSLDKAINLAQLDELLSELPNGTQTIVGEHGSKLSGGQKQRIGIARALYSNPDLLIFDEATSALDLQTEQDLVQAIDSLKGKITMVVIAHRESALQSCDRLFNMSE